MEYNSNILHCSANPAINPKPAYWIIAHPSVIWTGKNYNGQVQIREANKKGKKAYTPGCCVLCVWGSQVWEICGQVKCYPA